MKTKKFRPLTIPLIALASLTGGAMAQTFNFSFQSVDPLIDGSPAGTNYSMTFVFSPSVTDAATFSNRFGSFDAESASVQINGVITALSNARVGVQDGYVQFSGSAFGNDFILGFNTSLGPSGQPWSSYVSDLNVWEPSAIAPHLTEENMFSNVNDLNLHIVDDSDNEYEIGRFSASVPEPSSALLLALGGLGCAARRRR